MLQTSEKLELKPEELADAAALPPDEIRNRLHWIASEARLILLAARAINEDTGAGGVDNSDANAAYAIERAAELIEKRLLDIAGGSALDRLERKAVASC